MLLTYFKLNFNLYGELNADLTITPGICASLNCCLLLHGDCDLHTFAVYQLPKHLTPYSPTSVCLHIIVSFVLKFDLFFVFNNRQ